MSDTNAMTEGTSEILTELKRAVEEIEVRPQAEVNKNFGPIEDDDSSYYSSMPMLSPLPEGPFPEQYCRKCTVAIGYWNISRRKVLKNRLPDDKKGMLKNVLTTRELEEVRGMIPQHIEHLDNCPTCFDFLK